jgi:hypothetical protein
MVGLCQIYQLKRRHPDEKRRNEAQNTPPHKAPGTEAATKTKKKDLGWWCDSFRYWSINL